MVPSSAMPGCKTGPSSVTARRSSVEAGQHRTLYPPSTRPCSSALRATPTTHTLGGSPQLVQECSVDNWKSPLRCDAGAGEAPADVIVALGKFDAMHIGHRSLAVKASADGCQPVLLSFSGIAQVLGLPVRLPLVAAADRPRVLASWAQHCSGRQPRQRMVPFHEIRTMSPEQFVAVLAKELGAAGVVAGRNYRFGYKAAGDARALQELGAQYGMRVHIVDLVSTDQQQQQSAGAQNGHGGGSGGADPTDQAQVSSSKIRELLSHGDVKAVQRLLGRQYRLVTSLPPPPTQPVNAPPQLQSGPQHTHSHTNGVHHHSHQGRSDASAWVPAQCYLNMPPAPGRYHATVTLAYRRKSRKAAPARVGAGLAHDSSGAGGMPAGRGGVSDNGPVSLQGDFSLQTGLVQECQWCVCEVSVEGVRLVEAGRELRRKVEELVQGTETHPAYLVFDFDTSL